MKARRAGWVFGALGALGGAACEEASNDRVPQAVLDYEQAQNELPTMLALQTELMTNTCSPNPGVCHQGQEYPELFTGTSLASAVGAACNIAPPAPEQGWDQCERAPSWVKLGDFGSAIAWKKTTGAGQWAFGVANPIPAEVVPDEPINEDAAKFFKIIDNDAELVFAPPDDWITTLHRAGDGMSITVLVEPKDTSQDIADLVDGVMHSVIEGDPNLNGVWGSFSAGPGAELIAAGSKSRSYLWRRMLGDVPGDRMPIANGPVTNAQMLALGCWIEGLDAAAIELHAPIDYDACSFAEDPPTLVEVIEVVEDRETGGE